MCKEYLPRCILQSFPGLCLIITYFHSYWLGLPNIIASTDVSSFKKFKFKIHMLHQRLRILHRTTSSLKSVVFFWWVENLATHIHDWWCGKVKMNANVFQVKKTYVPYFFIFLKYFSHSHIFSFFFFFLATLRRMWDLNSLQDMKPSLPAVEAGSLNHWTAREVPLYFLLYAEIILEQILCEISRAINT